MYALSAGSLAGIPQLLQDANAPISGDAYASRVQEYMNPYLDEVLNRTTSRLSQAADEAKAKMMASQGFRKAFGDTSLGVQNAELDKNYMNSLGDTVANLSYAGYGDAATRAQSALENERNRNLSTAQGYGNLSTLSSALGGTLDTKELQNIKNLLGAGTIVQGQNQKVLDVLNPEITGVQNYSADQLKNLAAYLNAFKGTNYDTNFSQQSNGASDIAQTLTALGGLKDSGTGTSIWDTIFK
jgi:hypothetical protein